MEYPHEQKIEKTFFTQGIQLWSKPFFSEAFNSNVFFLECQSLGDKQNHDSCKLANIVNLISSVVVLSTSSHLRNEDFLNLKPLLNAFYEINLTGNKCDFVNKYAMRNYLPFYLWLLRDFKDDEIPSNLYLEQKIYEVIIFFHHSIQMIRK